MAGEESTFWLEARRLDFLALPSAEPPELPGLSSSYPLSWSQRCVPSAWSGAFLAGSSTLVAADSPTSTPAPARTPPPVHDLAHPLEPSSLPAAAAPAMLSARPWTVASLASSTLAALECPEGALAPVVEDLLRVALGPAASDPARFAAWRRASWIEDLLDGAEVLAAAADCLERHSPADTFPAAVLRVRGAQFQRLRPTV